MTHSAWYYIGFPLVVFLMALGVLTGCGGDDNPPTDPERVSLSRDGKITEQLIKLSTGDTVRCLTWADGSGYQGYGGMSCDWNGQRGFPD